MSFKSMAATSSLTLYFIPSPKGMDWSSPANLAWSALKNRISFQSRFLGHVFAEVQCGQNRDITGMVGKRFDYLNQLLIQSRGLGVLYHSFEGGLEVAQEVDEEIKDLSETGERLNFVKFLLNEGQCQRLMTYLKEYREKNVGRYYGLANRPRYGEGAGCSAFGASFTEVAGVLDLDIKEAWSHTVNIPLAYAGPPLKEEGVSLFKLMMNASKWAKEDEPHQKLFFWSPDLMFDWVKSKLAKSSVEKQFVVETRGKVQGIVYDKSHLPAPEGPIWLQHLDPNIKTTKK
jgi:hypothetical protein